MNNPENEAMDSNIKNSADLLIELGCEELPPKSLSKVGNALFAGFLEQLEKAELSFSKSGSKVYYTPRRLALLISGVAASQPDQVIDRKGPALSAAFDDENQPTAAAAGFGCMSALKAERWLEGKQGT